ncbi:MAG TPA: rRNA maturation RNase YbeY [Anaeromyxobacter sp.]|nr:rRNA maturation RNase YbeY [Anaeromyxobacter sp.]
MRPIVRASSDHPAGASAARQLARRAAAFLRVLGRPEVELSLVITTDARIRGLNRSWRGKDRSTDVLSFPISEPPGSGTLLGDVVVSLDTAVRRARAEGRPLGAELERYLAHGLLHLLGYDHEQAGDARVMAEKEAALVRVAGLVGEALKKGGRGERGGRSEERWTRTPTSISTPSRSGSTTRGTRARSWPAGSRR